MQRSTSSTAKDASGAASSISSFSTNKIYNPDGTVLVAVNQRDRVVAENEKFVAYIPFAPRMPYEVHILPKSHQCSFIQTSPEERLELAKMLKLVLMKIYKLLG